VKNVIKELELFYLRVFRVITQNRAKELDLEFVRDVYGDETNRLNCRSIWKDNKGRLYRVRYLHRLFKLN
jgi:hypothetical protein